MTPWPRPSLIYFIKPVGMDGPIKIGCSSVPEARLASLAVWSPFPLEVIATCRGSYDLEQNLHECFFDAHLHHEWFRNVPALVEGIEKLRAGERAAQAFDLSARKGSIRKKRIYKKWTPERKLRAGWVFKLHAAKRRAEKEYGCHVTAPRFFWDFVYHRPKDDPIPLGILAKLEVIVANPAKFFRKTTDTKVAA